MGKIRPHDSSDPRPSAYHKNFRDQADNDPDSGLADRFEKAGHDWNKLSEEDRDTLRAYDKISRRKAGMD